MGAATGQLSQEAMNQARLGLGYEELAQQQRSGKSQMMAGIGQSIGGVGANIITPGLSEAFSKWMNTPNVNTIPATIGGNAPLG
jgi:hypothetical protein